MKVRGNHAIKRKRITTGKHSLRKYRASSQARHPLVWRVVGGVCALALVAVTPLAAVAAQEKQSATPADSKTGSFQQVSYVSSQMGTGPAKNEVVYAKLSADGATQGVYVVNSFSSDAAANVTDPGAYTEVTNLSTTDKLVKTDGAVSFAKPAGTFYYQGDLPATTALPWNISIRYTLDGMGIVPDQLGGKNGKLGITVSVTPNTSVDSVFADNYLLQISGTFPAERAMNIVAEGATVADSGSDKMVNYMLLPGQSKTYTLTADVTDFEFGGFQISGVPLSMTLDVDNFDTSGMTSEMDTLKNSIAELSDGTNSASAGAAQIGEGLDTLAIQGMSLGSASQLLVNGSAKTLAGLNAGIADAQEKQAASQTQVAADEAALFSTDTTNPGALAVAGAGLQQAGAGLGTASEALTAAMQKLAVGGTLDAADLAGIQTGLVSAGTGIGMVDITDIGTKAGALATHSGELGGYIGAATALSGVRGQGSEADPGLLAFDAGVKEFDSGVAAYTGGVSSLASKYGTFKNGVELLACGTTQLKDATSNLDQQLLDRVKQEITNYMDYSFSPRSFVSSTNTNVNQVQFVFMTDAINAPEVEVELPEEQPTTIIDRIVGLFS